MFCGTRGHFDKRFIRNTRAKVPQGNILELFLDTIKATFWIENFIQRRTQSGPFFPKIWPFFSIFNKEKGKPLPLPPRYALMSVAEYASVSLSVPKYPWKCLNKLFWLCQRSEYAWSSYMFDRHLKIPWDLNVPRL